MDMQIRKIIAKRLLESKLEVPHYYLRGHADLRTVNSLRQTFKEQGSKVNTSISRKALMSCQWDLSRHCLSEQCPCKLSLAALNQVMHVALPRGRQLNQPLLCRCLSMTSLSEQLLWRWQMSQEQTHSGIRSRAKWCPARALTSP